MGLTRWTTLRVEELEARETPTVTAAFSGGTLNLRGDNSDNNLVIAEIGASGKFNVTANGNPVGQFSATNLNITMGNGNDTVDLGINKKLPGYLTVNLGAGDDSFTTKNSTVGAALQGIVSIGTGSSTPTANGTYDDIVELYNLDFNGPIVQVTGSSGSAADQLDIETQKIAGALTARNIYATFLGSANDPTHAPTIGKVSIDNSALNTDTRSDAFNGAGNVVFVMSGTRINGNFTYNGGPGSDSVDMPGDGGTSTTGVTITGSVSMLARAGVNTLSLGDGSNGAQINGSVTFIGGSDVDRFFMDSGSKIGGNVTLNLLGGNNQVFGDSIGQVSGTFDPSGSANVGGNLTSNLTITTGGGNNTGDNAAAPGAITLFNSNLSVAQTVSYTAGGGSQDLEISNTKLTALRIKLGGGADTVNFPITDYFGNATIDFGIGFGPKNFDTDGTPTNFHGKLTLLHFP
jgi:hypothetical protein